MEKNEDQCTFQATRIWHLELERYIAAYTLQEKLLAF